MIMYICISCICNIGENCILAHFALSANIAKIEKTAKNKCFATLSNSTVNTDPGVVAYFYFCFSSQDLGELSSMNSETTIKRIRPRIRTKI